jgi:hypothetical protein
MGFRYQLRLADGDDAGEAGEAGEAEYAYQPRPGDLVYVNGARQMRVTAVLPFERIEEFLDRPVYGVLEVEPI